MRYAGVKSQFKNRASGAQTAGACLTLLLFSQGAYAQEVKVNEVLRSLFYAPQHNFRTLSISTTLGPS